MTARKPSKSTQEIQQLAYREMIRQAKQIHNFNIFAMATPILVAMAGCYFIYSGQPAGATVTAVGTIATTVCIPLSKISNQAADRKLGKLIREAKELQ